MLKPTNATIQNYGSALLLFLKGASETETIGLWTDLMNFGATGRTKGGTDKHNASEDDEPNFVADNVISCWTTEEKLKSYFFNRYILRLSEDKHKGKKGGVSVEAKQLAEADYAAIATESFRSVNSNYEPYEMGVIDAAKPDDNFVEECYKLAFAS